jgi:hypothetical protein
MLFGSQAASTSRQVHRNPSRSHLICTTPLPTPNQPKSSFNHFSSVNSTRPVAIMTATGMLQVFLLIALSALVNLPPFLQMAPLTLFLNRVWLLASLMALLFPMVMASMKPASAQCCGRVRLADTIWSSMVPSTYALHSLSKPSYTFC